MTKRERILALLEANPEWSYKKVADAVETTRDYVATVKSRWGAAPKIGAIATETASRGSGTRALPSASRWQRVDYDSLNAKQQELYLFQKSAAVLAEYGFNCIKLADDWRGADFLADHKEGDTLRVQLKSRLTIDRKYMGQDLWMNFPASGSWYLIEHDELVRTLAEEELYVTSPSWTNKGAYSNRKPRRTLLDRLAGYRMGDGV